jgi:hypothetical protein
LRRLIARRNGSRLVAGAIVLLAHLALFDALYVIGTRPSRPQEIFFTLPIWTPPSKAPAKPEPKKRAPETRPAPLFRFDIPSTGAITLPEQSNALEGLGRTLACSNADHLSPEEQTRCAEKTFKWTPKDDHGLSLVVKAPPPAMTAAERTQHIQKTEDPCLIFHQNNTHVPECLDKVIFGDRLP